jgi:hypothetical protein
MTHGWTFWMKKSKKLLFVAQVWITHVGKNGQRGTDNNLLSHHTSSKDDMVA